jgi:hypothetical protein
VVRAYSFRCFTAVLTSHVPDGEDRNRLERKVSNLLQLALIPDGKVSLFSWLDVVLKSRGVRFRRSSCNT